MARPEHEPTADQRKQAEAMASYGVPQDDIAKLIGVSLPTLHKHYRRELDEGMSRANAIVAKRLFSMTETNVAAAIFWSKVRMGWSERHKVEVTGADGGPVATTVDAAGALGALMQQLAAQKAEGSE